MVHEIIRAQCPQCSTDEPVPHEILKERPTLLIKCTLCSAIHPHFTEKKKKTSIRLIVSTGETSTTRRLTLDSDEIISVGDEFIAEDDHGGNVNFVLVNSIESGEKRVDSAQAGEIKTVWTRSTDRVTPKIAITRGWQTESIEMDVPGDHLFTIGEVITHGSGKFLIKKIKIRDGKLMKDEGKAVEAKYVKRIFADSMERVEWLNRPKKSFTKRTQKSSSGRSVIRAKGPVTWTSKRKGKD
jgi:uncharacterized Zn finger protein